MAVQRYVRTRTSGERQQGPSLSARLGEAAARAAIGTGIGLAGQVGKRMVGNLFQKGGAAELAMTPQQTLEARAAAAEAGRRKTAAQAANVVAQAKLRQAQAARVPAEIEAKRASAQKSRTDAAIAPLTEQRMQRQQGLNERHRKLERQHDKEMAGIEFQFDKLMEGTKADNRRNLEKLKARLKKAGRGGRGYVLANGAKISGKELYKVIDRQTKQYNAFVKANDSAGAQRVLDEMGENIALISGSVPILSDVNLDSGGGPSLSERVSFGKVDVQGLPPLSEVEKERIREEQATQLELARQEISGADKAPRKRREFSKQDAVGLYRKAWTRLPENQRTKPNQERILKSVQEQTGVVLTPSN